MKNNSEEEPYINPLKEAARQADEHLNILRESINRRHTKELENRGFSTRPASDLGIDICDFVRGFYGFDPDPCLEPHEGECVANFVQSMIDAYLDGKDRLKVQDLLEEWNQLNEEE